MTKHDPEGPKYKGPSSTDYREQRSQTRGVYLAVYLAHENSIRVKQGEETNTRIMNESSNKSGRKERGHEGEKSQTKHN